MKLCFDNIEEVQDFVKRLKGTRGGKASDEGSENGAAVNHTAPAPLLPPQGGPAQTFQPGPAPGAQFSPQTGNGAFPGGGVPAGVDPAVQALVTRINTRIDGAVASGQPADQVLAWFRGQCGPEAANATMDQIKTVFLPKAPGPTLENIAKLMNA